MKLIHKFLLFGFLVSLLCYCEKYEPEPLEQDWYMYLNGEKVFLTVKENTWILMVHDTTFTRVADELNLPGIHKVYDKVFFIVEDKNKLTSIQDELAGFVYVSPLFLLEGGSYMHSTGELLIRWKQNLSDTEIQDIIQKYNLRPIEGDRVTWLGDIELYELMQPYEYLSIEIANLFYENDLVEFSESNFAQIIKQ
jgi:hypothetical protein